MHTPNKFQASTLLLSIQLSPVIFSLDRGQNTKDMAEFSYRICYDHNFLHNAAINLIFDQWSTIFPILAGWDQMSDG